MTNNLAGVPSIVLGFGMSLFVNKLEFGDSILGWINVRVISASGYHQNNRGIIKAVDDTFRQASFGLGPVSGKRRVKLYFQSHFQISLPD
jgi:phosphate transport system permease protein